MQYNHAWQNMFRHAFPSRILHCSLLVVRTIRRFASTGSPTPALGTTVSTKLRQYQEECIESVLSHLKQGHKRLGISLATGSGKTVVFTHLIKQVPPNNASNGDQTLILAHRRELVEQAVRHCSNTYPDKRVEIEMGNSHASGYADITVASIASIISGDRLSKFDPSRFKLVLVDEAHHIVARTYMDVLNHFKLLGDKVQEDDTPALVGVSATLSRFDGLKLGAAIDHIVYHKDYVDMIGEKWLSDVMFTTIKSHVDLSQVKSGAFGDFALGELSRAVNTDEANDVTVRSWMTKAGNRKSTLVFCVDIAHVESLSTTFRKHGFETRYITGKDRASTRAETLDDFRKGKFPILLNCGVFTEGTDIPNIDCVLLARPTRSRNLLVQMIGRGMRLHPGKENCHIIDMVASLETGIVTVPTLFGLDLGEIVADASVDHLKDIKEKRLDDGLNPAIRPQGAPVSKVTFTDYDSVHDLLSDSSGDRHIRALSRLAWVEVDRDRYVLGNRYGGFVEISGEVDAGGKTLYTIRYNEKVQISDTKTKWRPYKRTRQVGMSSTFEGAVRAADTFVDKSSSFEKFLIGRDASWRNYEPSLQQLEMLNSIRDLDKQWDATNLTKGQATDMIMKMKHGAKGRFNRVKAMAKKMGSIQAKEEEKRRREHVKVGPVQN